MDQDATLALFRRVKLGVFPQISMCSGLQDFLGQFVTELIFKRRDLFLEFLLQVFHLTNDGPGGQETALKRRPSE